MIQLLPYLPVFGSFVLATIISLVLVPTIINVVQQKNLYDMPNERAAHSSRTPTLGGVAVFLSLMLVFPFFGSDAPWQTARYILVAITIMFSIGLKDDILAISASKKMLGQVAAAFILSYFADIRISDLQGFNGIHQLPYWLSIVLSIVGYVGIINAYNFIDGIDGLAAGIGISHSIVFAVWFAMSGELWLAVLASTLAGGLLGFFPYNVYSRRFKIFMGDTGSLLIGLLLAIFAFEFNELNLDTMRPYAISSTLSVTFAIMVLPLFDIMRVVFVRLVLNKSLSSPDKLHIHHRMLRLGLSHRVSSYWLIALSFGFAIFGLYFQFISIRRLLLLELLLAMWLFYLPTLIYDLKQHNKKDKADDNK